VISALTVSRLRAPVKTPRPNPNRNPEWRTSLIPAGVIALLCVAIVIVAAMRYF
jgi:hypothetical protein